MRSTPTLGTGRISDRVHAVAIQLRGLEDLRQVDTAGAGSCGRSRTSPRVWRGCGATAAAPRASTPR
jgi:hypothetical protein